MLVGRRWDVFKENLKRFREAAGYTEATLAAALDVPKRTLEGWAQGRREPRLGFLVSLASVLGVSTDALLEGEPVPKPKKPATSKGKTGAKGRRKVQ
jgi:transcriptional regulator with XRE-family HTH domain